MSASVRGGALPRCPGPVVFGSGPSLWASTPSRPLRPPPACDAGSQAGLTGASQAVAAAAAVAVAQAACGRRSYLRRGQVARKFFGGLADLGLGEPCEITRRRLTPLVEKINALGSDLQALGDSGLLEAAADLRRRAKAGEDLDALLPEAFALVREASARTLGLRHFDVQLMGGIVMHQGGVAEMATGEGKTLAAILPAFLNALSGQGVHIVTTNDYLARRDAEWVGQPLRFLGLSVGVVQASMSPVQRQVSYACDVTYVTNVELGFDYLRDQMAKTQSEMRLRQEEPFHCAIVDEADSVLIDEGRTPLVVSAQAEKPSPKYAAALQVADLLKRTSDYTLEEKQRLCTLTEAGSMQAAAALGIDDLFNPQDPWAPFVVNAVNAKEFYLRDRQYLVRDGKVISVDEFTGRPMDNRRYGAGLHQAIEAKEGVEIQPEAITLATISYQNLFRLFGKLCGMTGTAATEARELEKIYGLKVCVVPTNRPCLRLDDNDQVYSTDAAKWQAVATEVRSAYLVGRPVLVGTTSVENSETLAVLLDSQKVPYRLLNAKPENAAAEAEIIAAGGRKGAVTIATNMAGRGTDIVLGGDSKVMAQAVISASFKEAPSEDVSHELRLLSQEALNAWGGEGSASEILALCFSEAPAWPSCAQHAAALQQLRQAYENILGGLRGSCELERQQVAALGGLYVLGTERHEARRVDRQLRGRAGRQGDPGGSCFYLSLSDNVFRVFGGDTIQALVGMDGPADVPLASPLLSGALDEAQKQVESYFFGIRKEVYKFDLVLDQQRQVIYALRRRALLDDDEGVSASLRAWCEESMTELVQELVQPDQALDSWPWPRLAQKTSAWFTGTLAVTPEQLRQAASAGGQQGADDLAAWLRTEGLLALEIKEAAIDADAPGLRHAVRRQLLLMQVDKFWRRHLENMDFLKQSAKLRSYGQREPLVEYKLEGYKAFMGMMGRIRRNTVYSLFTFMPRPLRPVSEERLAALCESVAAEVPAALPEVDVKLRSSALGRVSEHLRLQGSLAPQGLVSQLLEEAGLPGSRAAQLRWLHACDELQLLEDEFAQAVYVGLRV